ncbi:superinfection immunity protein [Nocardioides sp. YIM 152315]|uniref:superinfection immunity protein n=1 Tax=Nocardioides sp. YIM 152315 TaxID=3031760 RepID=UPI0023DA2EC1|nr:superinfection immunity protein [Nocardioides sp. YIM 152315]MDF1605050.1 superinfection immunity protein [Nocardioides sp. YIM 152315]
MSDTVGGSPEKVPPGWYPADGELRWWDGDQWTEHRAPLVGPASPAAQPVGYPTQAATYRYGTSPVLYTDARTNGAEVVIAWIATVLTLGYMLPWAIAATRGKSNSWAVGLVNFLLGWTFVGWVVALVMACSSHQVVAAR